MAHIIYVAPTFPTWEYRESCVAMMCLPILMGLAFWCACRREPQPQIVEARLLQAEED